MKIQLIEGQFTPKEALDFITQFIHIKIRFHEDKIHAHSSEEDIKMREQKIQKLQKQLYEAKKNIDKSEGELSLSSEIIILGGHGE